ncbi:MAG: hypothetical protein IKR86_09040, partial [Candidatus Methanomethylophilaceae archaeon]|nr:hypothetical protein [Candidatus Methanomethylophilaceae archaeon]
EGDVGVLEADGGGIAVVLDKVGLHVAVYTMAINNVSVGFAMGGPSERLRRPCSRNMKIRDRSKS